MRHRIWQNLRRKKGGPGYKSELIGGRCLCVCISCQRPSCSSADTSPTVSLLRGRVSELKLDNDRLHSEVLQLTNERDSMSTVVSSEVRAGRRREDLLDREVRRLREKLEVKQRAVSQRDEQLGNRNMELVFLAGQLVKVGQGQNLLVCHS